MMRSDFLFATPAMAGLRLWPDETAFQSASPAQATTNGAGVSFICLRPMSLPSKKERAEALSLNTGPCQNLTEQLQNRLFCLSGELQGLNAQLLPRLQCNKICPFFIQVSQCQLA